MRIAYNTKDIILRIDNNSKSGYDFDKNNPTFKKLIKTIDTDKWYYKDKKIFYNYNEYGYRGDKLSTINDNDYLLTFGCSYTHGVGLENKHTYSHKLSKKLNLKNINLSVAGSGIQIQDLNTTLFVNYFKNIRLPKYVIYQYPNDYRVTLSKHIEDKLVIESQSASSKMYDENYYIENYYLKNQGEKYVKDVFIPLKINNIWESLGVPIFHITFNDYIQELKSDFQNFEILNIKDDNHNIYERARDLSHNGRKFHDKVYKTILNKIKNG